MTDNRQEIIPAGAPMGRPSEYSDERADAILARLCEGESLRSICRDDAMPNRQTVVRWMDAHETFAAKYARAKSIGIDERIDRVREDIEAEPDPARARLIMQHEHWYAEKLVPKVYGNKVDLTSSDGTMSPKGIADFYTLSKEEK